MEKPRDRPTVDDGTRASRIGRGGMTRSTAPTTSAVAVGIFLGLGALVALWLLAYPLALLVLAITFAEALAPAVRCLERFVGRGVGVSLVYVVVVGVVALVGWIIVPELIAQGRDFAEHIPAWTQTIGRLIARWDERTGGEITTLLKAAGGATTSLLQVPLTAARVLFDAVVVFFLSFYWLLLQPSIARLVLSVTPEARQPEVTRITAHMGHAMGGYVRGVVINAAITGSLAGLALWLAGIQFAVLLGLLTAVGELVPYVGPIVAGVVAVALALTQSTTKALLALVIYVGVDQIEGHVLTPNVMRQQTSVSQPAVIFAFLAGGALGGLLGALVAIPLSGAIRVLVLEVVVPAVQRRTRGHGPLAPAA